MRPTRVVQSCVTAAAVSLQCAVRCWLARRDARTHIIEGQRLLWLWAAASVVQTAWRRHKDARAHHTSGPYGTADIRGHVASASTAVAYSTRSEARGETETESDILVSALDITFRGTEAFLTCEINSFDALSSAGSSTPSLADADARGQSPTEDDTVELSDQKQQLLHSISKTPRAHWVWDLADVDWSKYDKNGDNKCLSSPPFTCGGVSGLSLQLYPHGDEEAAERFMSLYLKGPAGVLVQAALSVDGEREVFDGAVAIADGYGFAEFAPKRTCYWAVVVELLDVRHGFHWDLAGLDIAALLRGDSVESPTFSCMGVVGLWLSFFPHGSSHASDGFASAFLRGPPGVALSFCLTVVTATPDGNAQDEENCVARSTDECQRLYCAAEGEYGGGVGGCWGAGWHNFLLLSRGPYRYVRMEIVVAQVQTDERYSWQVNVDLSVKKLESAPFSCMGLKGLQLSLYPSASRQSSDNDATTREKARDALGTIASSRLVSVFLRGPPGVLVDFSIGVDGEWKHLGSARDVSNSRGWCMFSCAHRMRAGGSGLDVTASRGGRVCKVEVQINSWSFGFEWMVAETNWPRYKRGDVMKSQEFTCYGLEGLQLLFYPKGCLDSRNGFAALFLTSTRNLPTPPVLARISVDDACRTFRAPKILYGPVGWKDFSPMLQTYKQLRVEILEVRGTNTSTTLPVRPPCMSLYLLWAELSRIMHSTASHTCNSPLLLGLPSVGAGVIEKECRPPISVGSEKQTGAEVAQMEARVRELEEEARVLRLRAETAEEGFLAADNARLAATEGAEKARQLLARVRELEEEARVLRLRAETAEEGFLAADNARLAAIEGAKQAQQSLLEGASFELEGLQLLLAKSEQSVIALKSEEQRLHKSMLAVEREREQEQKHVILKEELMQLEMQHLRHDLKKAGEAQEAQMIEITALKCQNEELKKSLLVLLQRTELVRCKMDSTHVNFGDLIHHHEASHLYNALQLDMAARLLDKGTSDKKHFDTDLSPLLSASLEGNSLRQGLVTSISKKEDESQKHHSHQQQQDDDEEDEDEEALRRARDMLRTVHRNAPNFASRLSQTKSIRDLEHELKVKNRELEVKSQLLAQAREASCSARESFMKAIEDEQKEKDASVRSVAAAEAALVAAHEEISALKCSLLEERVATEQKAAAREEEWQRRAREWKREREMERETYLLERAREVERSVLKERVAMEQEAAAREEEWQRRAREWQREREMERETYLLERAREVEMMLAREREKEMGMPLEGSRRQGAGKGEGGGGGVGVGSGEGGGEGTEHGECVTSPDSAVTRQLQEQRHAQDRPLALHATKVVEEVVLGAAAAAAACGGAESSNSESSNSETDAPPPTHSRDGSRDAGPPRRSVPPPPVLGEGPPARPPPAVPCRTADMPARKVVSLDKDSTSFLQVTESADPEAQQGVRETVVIQEATEAASHCAFPGQEMVNSLCGSARTPAPPEPSMYLAPSQLFVTSRTAVASENSRLRMQLEKAEEEQNTLQARLLNSEEELDKSKRKSLTLEERLNRFSVTLDGIEITDMDPIINQLSRSRSIGASSVKGLMDEGCSSVGGGNDDASDVEQLVGRVISRTVHSSAASSPAHTRGSVGSSTGSMGTVQAREELASVVADKGDFVGDVMSGVLGACTNRSGSTVACGRALEELVQLDGSVADLQDDVVSGVVESFPSTRTGASRIGHSTRSNTSPAAALHFDPAEIENTWARLMLQEGIIVLSSWGDDKQVMGVLVLRIPLDTRCIERFSMERTQTRADESEFYNSVRQMMYI